MSLESIVETLLLPALTDEGVVLVTGDLVAVLSGHIESHQTAPGLRQLSMTDIMAGASADFSPSQVLLVSDFRQGDQSNRTSVIRLLGYLRDRSLANILHLVINDLQKPEWPLTESLAMGFLRRGGTELNGQSWTLYAFNIKSYKPEPDWLNAKNWAHPHLW